MRKLLLIINPVSGTLKSRAIMFDLVNEFCKNGWTVTTAVTQKRRHAIELAATAADEGFELIVCCGGDGTLNEVVNGLISSGSRLLVGYGPAGSTNDFADNLGLTKSPVAAAKAICAERPFVLDVGHFCGKDYFTYVASFGAFTDASYSAPQNLKNTFGSFAYMMEGIKDVVNIKAYDISISTPDETITGDFVFGAVSNTKRMAGFVHIPVTEEELHDGKFELLFVRAPKDFGELNDIALGVTTGKFDENSMFIYRRASRVEIRMREAVNWSLDGEKKSGVKNVVIENLRDALTLYR
ncbi:MAG TPA: diacylglycerol kinase family lipid kinase [Bacillota bacterium]|nr:diacylglycerol kinase family lipid kinase [Bacillota bacterium]